MYLRVDIGSWASCTGPYNSWLDRFAEFIAQLLPQTHTHTHTLTLQRCGQSITNAVKYDQMPQAMKNTVQSVTENVIIPVPQTPLRTGYGLHRCIQYYRCKYWTVPLLWFLSWELWRVCWRLDMFHIEQWCSDFCIWAGLHHPTPTYPGARQIVAAVLCNVYRLVRSVVVCSSMCKKCLEKNMHVWPLRNAL